MLYEVITVWQYAFPSACVSPDRSDGVLRRFHMSARTLQKSMREAVRRAGIQKRAGCHTLRHSFATHLIENGYDIRTVQDVITSYSIHYTKLYEKLVKLSDIKASARVRVFPV